MKYIKTLSLALVASIMACLSNAGELSVESFSYQSNADTINVPTGGVDAYAYVSGSQGYAIIHGVSYDTYTYSGNAANYGDQAGFYMLITDAGYQSYALACIFW